MYDLYVCIHAYIFVGECEGMSVLGMHESPCMYV